MNNAIFLLVFAILLDVELDFAIMKYFGILVLLLILNCEAAFARTESVSSKDILRTNLLDYFTPYLNLNESEVSAIQTELLNTSNESNLFYPPFPRTWIERYSSETKETHTKYVFDTSKIAYALSTFAGGMISPLNIIVNGLQLGFNYEHSIKYTYTNTTTLMIMSSWRQAKGTGFNSANTTASLKDILENSIIVQKPDLRNYLKVSKEYPLVAMCKYEMSMAIQKTDTGTLGFVVGSKAEGKNIIDGASYTVYSNFFQIEGHIPLQDYLHVRCGEGFTEAVLFLVQSEFNKMVTEAFAHYHPKSECRWSPPSALTPKTGDQDCFNWYKKLDIISLNKKETVPRCVLGEEGYPVCTIRTAKKGAYCPIYASHGNISAKEPSVWDRQLNPMENLGLIGKKELYPCDHGLSCRLENGKPISSINLSKDLKERKRHLQNANYITTCQPVVNYGGK